MIHPFYIHKMDSGPVRLMTIAHAFNYRMAVLRDGVRSAVRVGIRELRGEQPNVQLIDNPWGHVEHCVAKCNCMHSDRTGAYLHCLLPRTGKSHSTSLNDAEVSVEIENGFTFNNDCGYLGSLCGVYTVCIKKKWALMAGCC